MLEKILPALLLVVSFALIAGTGRADAPSTEPSASSDPAAAASTPSPARDPHRRVRGMTITCPGAGRIWGSDAMVETMAELKALGVNWVTIHPYAAIREDGTVGSSRMDQMYDDPSWITRPIREAHRLGLKIMIKPHLAYWGSPYSWRGEITYHDEAHWQRFFSTYEKWITKVASLSTGADAFVVGTELGGTTMRETEWRRVIAAVRRSTDAPLTYAANWDRYEAVPFWDAVDAIGIQGYFPLVGHEAVPTQRELDRAWATLIGELEAYGRKHRRSIILAELGYNLSSVAARRPWEYRTGGEGAEEVQRRCMNAALRAIENSEIVTGAFLWKWFPGQRRNRGNFIMSTNAMRQVISDHWSVHLAPEEN